MESSCTTSINLLGLDIWSPHGQQYGARPAFGTVCHLSLSNYLLQSRCLSLDQLRSSPRLLCSPHLRSSLLSSLRSPLLSSRRSSRRSSLLRFEASVPPELAWAITTGWCSGLLRGLSGVPVARAAACFSHISLDLTQISSICS